MDREELGAGGARRPAPAAADRVCKKEQAAVAKTRREEGQGGRRAPPHGSTTGAMRTRASPALSTVGLPSATPLAGNGDGDRGGTGTVPAATPGPRFDEYVSPLTLAMA